MVTLEEGKFYRTRGGFKAGPAQYSPGKYVNHTGFDWNVPIPSIPGFIGAYRLDGTWGLNPNEEMSGDIIAEWVDEKPEPLTLHTDGKLIYTSTMTLRDEFAIAALQGIGNWTPPHKPQGGWQDLNTPEALQARAEWAYRQADAMLAARS